MVEKSLDIHGDEILYVGDHIFTDVSQSKVHLRWRTALICRELEDEVRLLTFVSSLYKTKFCICII
jgi:predicted HAD superfamily phosphohydrolase YqeG